MPVYIVLPLFWHALTRGDRLPFYNEICFISLEKTSVERSCDADFKKTYIKHVLNCSRVILQTMGTSLSVSSKTSFSEGL